MATKGISVQSSRFALLQIDDDDSDEEQTKSVKQTQNKPGNAQTGQAKKKNKKKKKEAAENAQVIFLWEKNQNHRPSVGGSFLSWKAQKIRGSPVFNCFSDFERT